MRRFGNVTKKLIPLFVVGAMIAPMAKPSNAAVKNDYQNHWAKSTIQSWVDQGYIKGVGDQGVLPNKEITRAEFVRMVNMRFGYNESAETNKFNDVQSTAWYYKDVMCAQKEGYIAGISATQFAPNMSVSREQAGTIVARIADVGSDEEALKVFKDVNEFSKYAKGPIGAATKQKIVAGYEDSTFRPKKILTRAEAMVLLDKAYEASKLEMKKEEVKQEFKVTFDSDGGSKVDSQVVKKGQKVKKPSDPTKKDFKFDAWYLDGSKFDFDTKIEKDITLKAKWYKPKAGGGGGGGAGGPSGPSTPNKEEMAKNIADKAGNASAGFKVEVSGTPIDIKPNQPMVEGVNEYVQKGHADTKLDDYNQQLNGNMSRLDEIYFEENAGSYYFTEGRYINKLKKDILEPLGLSAVLNEITPVYDSTTHVAISFNNDAAKKVARWITSNSALIKKPTLKAYQDAARKLEEPLYSATGYPGSFTPVQYEITLTIDGTTKTVKNGEDLTKRDEVVGLAYNFYQELQKPSKDFLSKKHTIKLKVFSKVGSREKNFEATKEIYAKIWIKLPSDAGLSEKEKQLLNSIKSKLPSDNRIDYHTLTTKFTEEELQFIANKY